jgi:predicted methyltransferase
MEEPTVNRLIRTWRLALRVLVLALIVAAVPLPCMAQQPTQAAEKPAIRASLPAVVHSVATAAAKPAAAQATSDVKAPLESRSFFKTPAGAVVLAVVAVGGGYALYSMSHDRIKPQGR